MWFSCFEMGWHVDVPCVPHTACLPAPFLAPLLAPLLPAFSPSPSTPQTHSIYLTTGTHFFPYYLSSSTNTVYNEIDH